MSLPNPVSAARTGARLAVLLAGLLLQLPEPAARPAMEIWIGSNVGTSDLANLALEPEIWRDVAGLTKVVTFYSQAITANERSDCRSCEDNIFPKLLDRRVFHKLHEMEMQINVETGSVKDWDCGATQNAEIANRILDRFKSLDIPVDHLSMDEPFMAGEVWCHQPASFTADRVAQYMSTVRAHWENVFPAVPVSIGLLEPYPRHEMASIIGFVKMLIARGQRPGFFHLDVNKHEMAGRQYDDRKIQQDLRALASFLRSEAIPWGTFFASFAGDSQEEYREDFLDTVRALRRWYGPTPHLVFQSWERTTQDGVQVNRRPHNTPENDAYSLTGLVRDAIGILAR